MNEAPRRLSANGIERVTAAALNLARRLDCAPADAVARIEQMVAAPGLVTEDLVDQVRAVLRIRARRNERLAVDLFRDPAWDMLLELLVAHHERRPVSISSLCFASGVPATTALRYVERMAEEGLIVRSGDFIDHRRVLVAIAPDRVAAVELLVRELRGMLPIMDSDGEPAQSRSPPP